MPSLPALVYYVRTIPNFTKIKLEANHSQNYGLPLFFSTDSYPRGVAGGSAGSARADPKFWPNSTVLLPVPTLNYSLFLLVPTPTKISSYGPVRLMV